jgi:hypothetical protein
LETDRDLGLANPGVHPNLVERRKPGHVEFAVLGKVHVPRDLETNDV